MPDKKVSELPAATSVGGSDLVLVVSGGASLKATVTQVLANAGTGSGTVTTVSASVPSGLSVAVTNATTTPAVAITTTLAGVLKGTGSGFAAAVAGTDYLAPAGNGSGLTALNASALASGTVPTARLGTGTADSTTYLRGDGSWAAPSGGGSGTVTSVAMSTPGVLFSVAGSPVTTSGTLALSLVTQTANTVFAGPTTGSAATPTMRALVAADLPAHSATLLTSGTVATARLGSGTADSTTYLRGDGTWATPAGGGGSPGGSSGAVQYNNAGSFGGFGSWDGTTFTVGGGVDASAGRVDADSFRCPNGDLKLHGNGFLNIVRSNGQGINVNGLGANNSCGVYAWPYSAGQDIYISEGLASQTGAHWRLRGVSSTTAGRDLAVIDAAWATATDASRKGRLVLYAADSTGTNREGVRVESSGSAPMLGFFGAAAVTKPATPTTLADVISLLQSLGLCS